MKASLDVVWVGAVGAFAITALAMPLVLRGWQALGRRDQEVSLRKVHTGEIPRAGGLVMLLGFGVMLLSSFPPVRNFGILIGVTVFGTLIATILVLPALLKVGARPIDAKHFAEDQS